MLYIDFIDFKTNPQSCEFTQPVGHRLKPHTVKYYSINIAMTLVTNLQEHLNPCRTWNKHWQEGKPWVTNDTTQTWRTWQFSKKGGGRAKETLSFDGEKRKQKVFHGHRTIGLKSQIRHIQKPYGKQTESGKGEDEAKQWSAPSLLLQSFLPSLIIHHMTHPRHVLKY